MNELSALVVSDNLATKSIHWIMLMVGAALLLLEIYILYHAHGRRNIAIARNAPYMYIAIIVY